MDDETVHMDEDSVESDGDGMRDGTDRILAMVMGLFLATATTIAGIALLLSGPDSGRAVVRWDWFVTTFFLAYAALWWFGTRIAAVVLSAGRSRR